MIPESQQGQDDSSKDLVLMIITILICAMAWTFSPIVMVWVRVQSEKPSLEGIAHDFFLGPGMVAVAAKDLIEGKEHTVDDLEHQVSLIAVASFSVVYWGVVVLMTVWIL